MKKLLALALCICMVFSLVACASTETTSTATTTETTTTTTSTTDAEVATSSEAEEATAEAVATTSEKVLVEDSDTFEGAVLYEDLVDLLGPIPTPAAGTTVGFAAKAFENEYWAALKTGVEDQGLDLPDLVFDVRAAQGESDEQGQAAVMNDMINKGYDVIIASPISDGNLVQSTEKAQAAGIPVVNAIGGFCNVMNVFIGPQHTASGELAAAYVAEKLGAEGGEVAVIVGMAQESAARNRTDGFINWFAENSDNITVVDSQDANWDRGTARDVMETMMKSHPDLKAVYANNDTMAMGALEAIISAGKQDDILIIGNDGTSEALASIADGQLDATVNIYPDYGGKIAVDVALRLLGGQDVPQVIYTSQAVIDSTNIDVPAEEIIGWNPLVFD